MPANIDLLEEVYAFARARAVERTQRKGMDVDAHRVAMSHLRNLQWAYAEAKQMPRTSVIAAGSTCAGRPPCATPAIRITTRCGRCPDDDDSTPSHWQIRTSLVTGTRPV